jgi:YD repeat-containing protein
VPDALAIVDMKNGNFTYSWMDLESSVVDNAYTLDVKRTYNSRSKFKGLFGLGWCSNFDTKLGKKADGSLVLIECGSGMQTVFTTKNYNSSDIELQIKKILGKIQEKGPKSEADINALKEQLKIDEHLRNETAIDLGIIESLSEGDIYYANGTETESISFRDGVFTYSEPMKSMRQFDHKGRLMASYDKYGHFIKYKYEGALLKTVENDNKHRLHFNYDKQGNLQTIFGPLGKKIIYEFKNNLLIGVTNAWGNKYQYKYDGNLLMTKATWPNMSFIQVTYDNDITTSFQDSKGCIEKYKYDLNNKKFPDQYSVSAIKDCEEVKTTSKYDFFYKTRSSDGVRYLERTLTAVDDAVTEIQFHEIYGKPILIRKPDEIITFTYSSDGLVKTKISNTERNDYQFDKASMKISKLSTLTFGRFFFDGYRSSPRETLIGNQYTFNYNSYGEVVFANNGKQTIQLTYDNKGRIASVVDQDKKMVQLKYDHVFGKPSEVSLVNVGAISVSYDNKGEISNIKSSAGPTVASEVAAVFNQLLEIIKPVSREMYNL